MPSPPDPTPPAAADPSATFGRIAHDLATPLQYVGYNAEFVRDQLELVLAGEPPTPQLRDELADAVAAILRGVDKLTAIVQAMRAIARRDER